VFLVSFTGNDEKRKNSQATKLDLFYEKALNSAGFQ